MNGSINEDVALRNLHRMHISKLRLKLILISL